MVRGVRVVRVVRRSGGPGGKVIRAVKVSMMARVVQTVLSRQRNTFFSLAAHAPEQTCRHCLPNCEEVRI